METVKDSGLGITGECDTCNTIYNEYKNDITQGGTLVECGECGAHYITRPNHNGGEAEVIRVDHGLQIVTYLKGSGQYTLYGSVERGITLKGTNMDNNQIEGKCAMCEDMKSIYRNKRMSSELLMMCGECGVFYSIVGNGSGRGATITELDEGSDKIDEVSSRGLFGIHGKTYEE